jgi:heavy metal sensor kinase
MRTIRARLTAWYSLLLLLTLVLLGSGVYVTMARALEGEALDAVRTLAEQAVRLAGSAAGEGDHQGAGIDLEDPSLARTLVAGGMFLEVYDARGRLMSQAPVLRGTTLAAPQGPAGSEAVATRHLPGIGPVLVYSRAVTSGDRLIATVVAGRSLAAMHLALSNLRAVLTAGSLLGVAAALLGGWLLADASLRPVDRLTRAARSISAGALDRRLRLQGPNDELHRLADAFDEMLDRLQQAFERERQFTADAAHELRTPLTVLQGELEVALRRPRSEEEYRRVLHILEEAVDRLSRLVADLLTLARAEAGVEVLRRRPMALEPLLHRVAASIQTQADAQRVVLAVRVPEGLSVNADEDRLFQALANLLDNAVRHTRSGGDIELGADAANDGVRIWVADTGEGIPSDHLPHIFQRFYRADAHRSRNEGGSGLGLAITKWIVEAHGGQIAVHSQPGRTEFTLQLPR